MSASVSIPVIAIDGPSASGKGTVAQRVAATLGFHYLDSGAIYRACALAARHAGIDLTDPAAVSAPLAGVAATLALTFRNGRVWLEADDVSEVIRAEACGNDASRIAVLPEVRAALLQRQRDFCQSPGLVADGRDMGSVVFPNARLKVFLTASAEARARRRVAQLGGGQTPGNAAKGLIEKENHGNLDALFAAIHADLVERDARDAARKVAPLKAATGAWLLDTTELAIEEAVEQVLAWFERS